MFFSREKYLKQNFNTTFICLIILHKYYLPYQQHFATLLTCQGIVCPLEIPENPKKVATNVIVCQYERRNFVSSLCLTARQKTRSQNGKTPTPSQPESWAYED